MNMTVWSMLPKTTEPGVDMNEELKALALRAGAPVEVLHQHWFNLFCMKFADVLLTQAEEEMFNIKNRVKELENE
jgi:hypothetical protein